MDKKTELKKQKQCLSWTFKGWRFRRCHLPARHNLEGKVYEEFEGVWHISAEGYTWFESHMEVW